MSQAAYVSCMQDSPRSGEQRAIRLSNMHPASSGATVMHTMIHVNTHAASCKRHWQDQSLSRTLVAIHRLLPSFGPSTLSDLRSGVGCMIVDMQLEVRFSCELYLILARLPVGTPTLLISHLGLGYLTASSDLIGLDIRSHTNYSSIRWPVYLRNEDIPLHTRAQQDSSQPDSSIRLKPMPLC